MQDVILLCTLYRFIILLFKCLLRRCAAWESQLVITQQTRYKFCSNQPHVSIFVSNACARTVCYMYNVTNIVNCKPFRFVDDFPTFSHISSIRLDGGRPARSKPSTKLSQLLKPEYHSRVFCSTHDVNKKCFFKAFRGLQRLFSQG